MADGPDCSLAAAAARSAARFACCAPDPGHPCRQMLTIEGCSAAAELVKDCEGGGGGGAQQRRRLEHLACRPWGRRSPLIMIAV